MGWRLVVFLLITYGISWVIVYGKLFEELRVWIKLYFNGKGFFGGKVVQFIECQACCSMWVGMFVSLTGYGVANFFYDGCMAVGAVFLLDALSEKLCPDC